MIIPIRCFTCGKVIANLWDAYVETKKRFESSTQEKITEELEKTLNLKRYCCKRMLICHVPIVDELLKYNQRASPGEDE
jgi:DNA-directed RNA polymerases I, II, and III subunit RPABC5